MEQHKPEKIASSSLPISDFLSFFFSSPLLFTPLLRFPSLSFPLLFFPFLSSGFLTFLLFPFLRFPSLPFPFPLLSSFSPSLLCFLSLLFSPFLPPPLLWFPFPFCPLFSLNFLPSFFLFHSITKASLHIFGQTRQTPQQLQRRSVCRALSTGR